MKSIDLILVALFTIPTIALITLSIKTYIDARKKNNIPKNQRTQNHRLAAMLLFILPTLIVYIGSSYGKKDEIMKSIANNSESITNNTIEGNVLFNENWEATREGMLGINNSAGTSSVWVYKGNHYGLETGDRVLFHHADESLNKNSIELIVLAVSPTKNETLGDFFVSSNIAETLGVKTKNTENVGIYSVKFQIHRKSSLDAMPLSSMVN